MGTFRLGRSCVAHSHRPRKREHPHENHRHPRHLPQLPPTTRRLAPLPLANRRARRNRRRRQRLRMWRRRCGRRRSRQPPPARTAVGRTLRQPADIERLWDKLYTASIPYGRGGIAIMALSGIDLALWDLLGRAERQPVYAMLGGSSRAPYPRLRLRRRSRMVRRDRFHRPQSAL